MADETKSIDEILSSIESQQNGGPEVPPNTQKEMEEQEEVEGQEEQTEQPTQEEGPPEDRVAQLEQQNERLQRRLDSITRMMSQQQAQPQPQAQQAPPQESQEEKKGEPEEEFTLPPNFDDMNKGELVEWIVREVNRENKQLQRRIDELEEGVASTRKESQLSEAQRQLKETAQKYPDFFRYQNDMIQLAQRSPGLHPEELYILAKSRRRQQLPQSGSGGNRTTQRPKQKEEQSTSTEKPGAESGGTTERTSYTRQEAIQEAMSRIDSL